MIADVMLHIGSFMDPRDAVSLAGVNKHVRNDSDQLLINQYKKTFGTLAPTQQPDKEIIARLLHCAEKQPDPAVNHNIYKAPSNFLERWKWLVGVKNSLDEEIIGNYNKSIAALENTQPTSIIQLKHQMQAFWHSDRQIKDYAQFAAQEIEKAQATSGLINKIFFMCVEFLFKKIYRKPSSQFNSFKSLEVRSRETFAKIGAFNLNSKDYDVVAFHLLADERSNDKYTLYRHSKFESLSNADTYIGILEKDRPNSSFSSSHNQNFAVKIGRKSHKTDNIFSESDSAQMTPVLGNRRFLMVRGLQYCDITYDAQGSDRLLDQKLTQIMVEMTMQNKEIIHLQVDSMANDFPVLAAGGFINHDPRLVKGMLDVLTQHRSVEGNKLFRPFWHFGIDKTVFFRPNSLTKKNVHYSREAPESWSDIIQRGPILQPNAGILPEYWVKKPNIVADKNL